MKEVSCDDFYKSIGILDVIPRPYVKTETEYVTDWELRNRKRVGVTTVTIKYPQVRKYYIVE